VLKFSPSMTANTPEDCEVKCGLLDDTFTIIDMEKMYPLIVIIESKNDG